MIVLDGEWLEDLSDPKDLKIGQLLRFPWQSKGGKTTYWTARLVEKETPTLPGF